MHSDDPLFGPGLEWHVPGKRASLAHFDRSRRQLVESVDRQVTVTYRTAYALLKRVSGYSAGAFPASGQSVAVRGSLNARQRTMERGLRARATCSAESRGAQEVYRLPDWKAGGHDDDEAVGKLG
ncbi:unannotated protein [freshwater metagenome]|uniref:Unannotated protein n=1 Tax=freshwater metagenome TaxID=449393 RepID=A0A6J7KFX9_9ZZZZ|nr:hypothetical protein [Actinomycetota bacterium]